MARAATLIVNKTADTNDGACNADCSLREAVTLANSTGGADTIIFNGAVLAPPNHTITLGGTQLPALVGTLTISAPAAGIIVSANNLSRLFEVTPGAVVTLIGLSLNNGNAGAAPGGAVFNDHGTLTLTNCTLRSSQATNGGAIYNNGSFGTATLTVTACTFNNNSTLQTSNGGAIFNDGFTGNATATVTSSTFRGNAAFDGGAIVNIGSTDNGATSGAILNVNHSTLANNTAFSTNAGGIYNESFNNTAGGATLNLYSTILASSLNSNVNLINNDGVIDSLGYNLADDNSSAFLNASGDLNNTDPKLGTLQENGGPTPTVALLPGSPAINAGDPAFAPPPANDQRGGGFPRVQGGRIDIGAFEAATLIINDVNITEANGGSAQAQFTLTLSAAQVKDVTVSVKTSPGGSPAATPGVDYLDVPATTVTFVAGEISKTVNVTIVGDTLDEADEKFALILSASTNAAIIDGTGIGTILDNDAAPLINVSAPNAPDGNTGDTSTMTFTISLSAASARNVSVQYQSISAATFPAAGGADYNSVPLTTVLFLAGETTKTVPVTIKGDVLDEDNERVALSLTNPVNATLGTISDGIIVDDDATPTVSITDGQLTEGQSGTKVMTFTISLSAPSGRRCEVTSTTGPGGSPSATPGVDYVAQSAVADFMPGQTFKIQQVTIYGDTDVESDEKFGLVLTQALNVLLGDNTGIGTIINDDAPPAQSPSS